MKPRPTARFAFPLACTIAVLLAAPSASAAVYYWDNDGAAGFGTAGGIWSAPTLSQWSTDPTGVAPPEASITTAFTDTIHFGNGATGLAAGTIAVSGTVDAGNMTFASGSGAIVLAGDPINLADAETISVNNPSDTISSILGGAATSSTKAGAGILNLAGANSYTGTTTINAGTLVLNDISGAIASSSAVSVGATAGPAGVLTLDNGTANHPDRVGSVGVAFNNGILNFIGNTTAASTESIGTITAATGQSLINLTAGAAGQVAKLNSTAGAIARTAGATLAIVADNTHQQFAFTDGSAGINKGVFFGATAATATDFAYYPGTSAAVLAPTYGTTTDFAAETNTALTANQHNKLNGEIVSQAAETIYSLNLPGNFGVTALTGDLTFTDAADQGAIIKSGGGPAQIGTAGDAFDIAGQSGGELVVNTVATADILTLNVGTTATATALTKTGTGTLTLTANRDYLHTGTTTVNQGTLELNSAATAGFKSNVTINNGGTVKLAAANKVIDTAAFTVNAGGTMDLNGKAETIASVTGSGTVTNPGVAATLTLNGNSFTSSTVFTGTGLSLTFIKSNQTYTLTGNSTYGGATRIGGASHPTTVILGANNALPSGRPVTVDASGVALLNLNGFDQTVGLLSLGSNNGGSSGTVTGSGTSKLTLTAGVYADGHNQGNNSTGTGVISVPFLDLNNATQNFTTQMPIATRGALTINSVIQNGGLNKTGALGQLFLTNANTFSGATTISVGVLRLDHSLALQNSPLDTSASVAGSTNEGLRIKTGVTTLTLGGLTGNKNFAATGGVFSTNSGTGLTNNYNAVTALTLNPGLGAAPSYSGVITNGAPNMALIKTGPGTQTLAGLNTYTGNTTVNAGTLALADNAQLKFVIGATSDTNNGITGAGTVTIDGDFNIDTTLSDASVLTSGSWTLVDAATLTETFGPSFTLIGAGWLETSNVWTKTVGTKKYTFDEATGILTLSPAASYASWIDGFFPGETNPSIIGVGADPDNDGSDNGVENFFGTNPGVASSGLVAGRVSGNTFTFTHPQNATPASDLTAAYQWSLDLGSFHASGASAGGITVNLVPAPNTPSAGTTTVTATVTGTVPPKLFVRLGVTQL